MNGSEQIRILIADDHPAMRVGLVSLLNSQPDMCVVAEASNWAEAIDKFVRYRPDVGVLDLRMPQMNGIQAISAIKETIPDARIVVLSAFAQDERIHRALRAGARGYLRKDLSLDRIAEGIRGVYEGVLPIAPPMVSENENGKIQRDLSPRERQVLSLIVEGKSNKEIAFLLNISEGTAKVHINRMTRKLGARCRSEAIYKALKQGIVDVD